MKTTYLLAAASLLTLSACGETQGDRALSGAGIGAGTGAVAGALMGDPWTGAAIGGVVGGAVGAMTDPDDIYFGRPAWR